MGVSPLIPFPAGRYFEVRVDRVRQEPFRRAADFSLGAEIKEISVSTIRIYKLMVS